jgi:prevent-host-death family protein
MLERYTSSMDKAPHQRDTQEVGVRELRDHLSRWLDEVKAGSELVITERGRPVARIIGSSGDSRLEELVAAGVITPAEIEMDASSFGRVRTNGDILEFVFEQRR